MGMPLDDSLLTEAALDVLGAYRLPGGWATGGFRESLINTWAIADLGNQARLAHGFPELAYAIELFKASRTDDLRILANGGKIADLKGRRDTDLDAQRDT